MRKLLVCLLSGFLLLPSLSRAADAPESAYDRIMRTGVIRCGYVVWQPYLLKDPNTGTISGLSFDYMTAIAKELNLKLEWTEETGWGTFQEGLNTGRYDLMCVPVWQSGQRALVALLSRPLFYNTLMAYARDDDHRFDASLESANTPEVKVVVPDGSAEQAVRRLLFPKATEMALPQSNDSAQFLLAVATRKGDVVMDNQTSVNRYNQTAEVRLHPIAGGAVTRRFGNCLAMKPGEFALKAMLDSTIEAVNTAGVARQLVMPYSPDVIPIAPGYE